MASDNEDVIKMDFTRPYGTIWGNPSNGARYTQDGVYYNAMGELMEESGSKPSPPINKAVPQEREERETHVDTKPLEELHWTQIRKLVTEAGGVYLGKEQGIDFLRQL
jgi:hypothetical protein